MHIGQRIELFVDKALIEKTQNVDFCLYSPEKKEKVFLFDAPWESNTSGYVTFIKDDQNIKMYYRGRDQEGEKGLTCVAYSYDGVKFFRPNLGLVEFAGSKSNNILLKHHSYTHNFTPFIDQNPDCKPHEKYKAVGGHENIGINESRLYGLVSSDGIHWQKIQNDPIMTQGMFDSQNNAFYDPNTQQYVCYSRYFENKHLKNPKEYEGIRAIQCHTSKDFIHWHFEGELTYDTEVLEEFYTNAITLCPGAPHHYLGFPKRFVPNRTKDTYTQTKGGISDAIMMSARSLTQWHRPFLHAWVRPGLDPKNWINRNNMPCLGIIDNHPYEFSMYLSENYRMPSSGLRRISIRKYGFASWQAKETAGTIMTKPFTFTGSHLYINHSTSATGFVRVELLDQNQQVIQSANQFGDAIFDRVCFEKPLEEFNHQRVQLKFTLQDADLYAFRFQ